MKRVLILEDDPIYSRLWDSCIKKAVKVSNIKIYPNVDSVLKEYKSCEDLQNHFDLIIVDVFLAGDMTGIQFISHFPKEFQNKIILSSSVSGDEARKLCLDDDLRCHIIQKPFELLNTQNIIADLLKVKESNIDLVELNRINNHQLNLEKEEDKKSTISSKPIIFITGCSSGVGYQLAKRLSQSGKYRLVITARHKSISIVKDNFIENDELIILPMDLTDSNQVCDTVSLILKKWGQINVLVNNAGVCYRTVTEQMDFNSELNQMQTNYLGPMNLIRYVLPSMREAGRGKIINVSSVSGIMGMPTMGSYSASKHALEGASESLWYELKPFGIDVCLVRPGFINSDGHNHVLVSHKARIAEKLRGPYSDFYLFMRPFVTRLMNFSLSSSENVADKIHQLIKTQNPPFDINVTLDAKFFYILKRMLPPWILRAFNFSFFSLSAHWGKYSKIKAERRNLLRVLIGKYYYKRKYSKRLIKPAF